MSPSQRVRPWHSAAPPLLYQMGRERCRRSRDRAVSGVGSHVTGTAGVSGAISRARSEVRRPAVRRSNGGQPLWHGRPATPSLASRPVVVSCICSARSRRHVSAALCRRSNATMVFACCWQLPCAAAPPLRVVFTQHRLQQCLQTTCSIHKQQSLVATLLIGRIANPLTGELSDELSVER